MEVLHPPAGSPWSREHHTPASPETCAVIGRAAELTWTQKPPIIGDYRNEMRELLVIIIFVIFGDYHSTTFDQKEMDDFAGRAKSDNARRCSTTAPLPVVGQWFAPEVVLPHHRVIQQQEAQVGNHLSRDQLHRLNCIQTAQWFCSFCRENNFQAIVRGPTSNC